MIILLTFLFKKILQIKISNWKVKLPELIWSWSRSFKKFLGSGSLLVVASKTHTQLSTVSEMQLEKLWFINTFQINFTICKKLLVIVLNQNNIKKKLDNFLVFVVISCCWSEVKVFQSYQELNAVRSENSEFSLWISCILSVFGEIIVYL